MIWGREWDELLARDVDGVLVHEMNETLDGEFQKFSVAGGAYIREHFFGPDPRLRRLVEHLSDDDLARLRRGGHDYRKVYAAYKAATEFTGAPTVILAKTIKGWTLGAGVEGRNVTHQTKKMSEAELRIFRDRLELPIPDAKLKEAPYFHPGMDSEEIQYLVERRRALGGPLPRRIVRAEPLPPVRDAITAEFPKGSEIAVSTTMVFTRLLRNLIRDPDLGKLIVPIIPDEARTFGMDPLFKEVGIYSALGPALRAGRLGARALVPRGDRRPGARGGDHRGRLDGLVPGRRHLVRDARRGDDPVLHLLLDVRLPADDGPDLGLRRCARPRLPDGRHRGPDDADGRGPPARRRPLAPARVGRPGRARVRPGIRLRARDDHPARHRRHVRQGRGRLLLRHALQRELPAARHARGRRGRDHPRHLPAARGAEGRPREGRAARAARGFGLDRASRSSPRRRCSPSSSASRPRSTARRRSSSCAPMRSMWSAGTGSTPTRSRGSRTSRRCSGRTAGR